MGFFDLNIPYHESDRNITAADKASLKKTRLNLVIKTMELGYTAVAYNRTINGVMSESDRCTVPLFPLPSLLRLAPSLSASVDFRRRLLEIPVSTPFRQYTRLTVVVDSPAQAAALNSGNPILKSYDVVAVRPISQNAFEQACHTCEVDVIAIDFSEKLPFRLKQPIVKAAIKRGVYFEITYSSLIMDAQMRRQMISNAKLLVDWTRGKNLIFSSGAPSSTEIRGPYDVVNLSFLLGLPFERAKAAISKTCRSLIAGALRRKHCYKEAIKVDMIPSTEQVNAEKSAFDDWLKWDPISSGEGDLLFDDIEKSFSAAANPSKTVKAVDFSSAVNNLPSHVFRISSLIPVTKSAPVPSDITKETKDTPPLDMKKGVDATNGTSEQPDGLNLLPEKVVTFRGHQLPSENIKMQPSPTGEILSSADVIEEAVVASGQPDNADLLPGGHTLPHDMQSRSPDPSYEDSRLSDLQTCMVDSKNVGNGYHSEDYKGPKISNMLGEHFNPAEAEMLPVQSQDCGVGHQRNDKPAKGTNFVIGKDADIAPLYDDSKIAEISTQPSGITFSSLPGKESEEAGSLNIVPQAMDFAPQEILGGKKSKMEACSSSYELLPLKEVMESHQPMAIKETLVTITCGSPSNRSCNQIAKVDDCSVAGYGPMEEDSRGKEKQIEGDPYQNRGCSLSGRERERRRKSHRPVLFSFKHLLSSKPPKKKAQRLKPFRTL